MEWTGAERRSGGSGRMQVERQVAIFAGGRKGILRARTVDLSTGGMKLDIGDGLGVGEKVLFRIDLGEGFDPAVQGGEVVWSEGDIGTGVRFMAAEDVEPDVPEEEPSTLMPAPGESIRLEIEKMNHPLKVHCIESLPEGIAVSTQLPFLERGRSVIARFGEGTLDGVLTRVSLEPDDGEGVPTIRLEIRTDGEEGPLGSLDEGDVGPQQDSEPIVEPPQEEPWEDEEPTERDAVVPDGPGQEEILEAAPEPDPHGSQTEPSFAQASPGPESGVPDDIEDEALADREDPMGDAFRSLTQESGITEEPAESIEPRYVVLGRAALAWALSTTRKLGELTISWSRKMWSRALPWMRKVAPQVLERLVTAWSAVRDLASRLPLGSVLAKIPLPSLSRGGKVRKQQRRKSTATRPTSMRRQTRLQGSRISASDVKKTVRSRVFVAALGIAALLGFGTGIWALVGLVRTGREDPAREQGASPSQPVPEVQSGSFDLWGGAALPEGEVAEAEPEQIEVVAPEPSPAPAGAQAAATAPPAEPAPAAADEPIPPSAVGGSRGFYLGVSGEVTGFDHYPLANPAGLVVDVKGAVPLQEGLQPVNRTGIKKVKAIARESGARFIIYFEGTELPDYQVLPAGSTLEVRLES